MLKKSQFPGKIRQLLFRRLVNIPPSHFHNPSSIPKPYGNLPLSSNQQDPQSSSDKIPPPNARFMKDFALLLSSAVMGYLTVDNYLSRIKVEKLSQETAAINMKTLQLQQQSFAAAVKTQEMRIYNERMVMTRRCFKMGLHVAMLRKQLEELGTTPATIDELTAEFEKSVKRSNTGPGSYLWLDENSKYKADMPDYREYDTKGKG